MVFGRNNFTPFSFKAHKKARYLYFVWHMAMCVCLGIWWWNGSTGFGFEILCNFLLLLHSTYFRLNIIASQTIIMKESFFQLKQMRVKHQMPTQTQSPHTKSYTFDETASVTLNAREWKNEWGGTKVPWTTQAICERKDTQFHHWLDEKWCHFIL